MINKKIKVILAIGMIGMVMLVAPKLILIMSKETPISTQNIERKEWINSNLVGNVTEETKVNQKDDFYQAVNFDWLVKTKLREGQSFENVLTEREGEVAEEVEALLQDDTLKSHEAKLVQQLYEDVTNLKRRNQLGIQPIMPFIESLQEIDSIDAMSEFLIATDQNIFMSYRVEPYLWDESVYAVYVSGKLHFLDNPEEYKQMTEMGERTKKAWNEFSIAALKRIGYGAEEAAAMWESAYEFETELAQEMTDNEAGMEEYYNRMTIADMEEYSASYPLVKYLEKIGCAHSEFNVVEDLEWLKKLNEMYTQENLERMKAYLLLVKLKSNARYLDEEFMSLEYDYLNKLQGTSYASLTGAEVDSFLDGWLGEAIGKLYVEHYFTGKEKAEVEEIFQNVKEVYRKQFIQNDWLGAETKQNALIKLDAIRVEIGRPEEWMDYSELVLESEEEGGSLIKNLNKIVSLIKKQQRNKINTVTDKNQLNAMQRAQAVNAYYILENNSILIPAGILGGSIYQPDAAVEELMGTLGMIMSHEITHSFDLSGSKFDKDGNENNWWTEADLKAFKERTDKIATYMGSFEVLDGEPVDGQVVREEITADLGAMSCMLELAKTIPDFDYDTFFRAAAVLQRAKVTEEEVHYMQSSETHPPYYLRVNVVMQQFQQFYDTYDIKEEDGMYLAPEDRIHIW